MGEPLAQTEKTEAPAKANVKWPSEIQSFVDWFHKLVPPEAPFYLEPHRHVTDPDKLFALLKLELETGPAGSRARMGTLQHDLQKLKAYLEQPSISSPVA